MAAGDITSECTGPLSKPRVFSLLEIKRLTILASELIMSPLSWVQDCLTEPLRLKRKRADDYEEYQCQIKNEGAVRMEETMHKISYRELYGSINKHKPEEVPVQSMSTHAVSASICLWIFWVYSQILLAKYFTTNARVSTFIAVEMLGMLSFMVIVWALCVWILVGGKLSPMNSALLLIWAILELFNSDNSIDEVYLPVLGIFFIGWHAMSSLENKSQMEEKKLLSTSIVVHKGDSMEAADRKMTRKFLAFRTTSYVHILMEDTMHRLSYELYNFINKLKPQVTAQRISSYAISASMFLWIFLIYGQTLLAKYLATKARVSTFIVAEMLGLLSFMVLVWAVGVKILVGGKLSRMNCVLFLLWAILKLFNSDNSINAVCLPLLGIFFIGWHAMYSPENKNQMEGKKPLSTSMVKELS